MQSGCHRQTNERKQHDHQKSRSMLSKMTNDEQDARVSGCSRMGRIGTYRCDSFLAFTNGTARAPVKGWSPGWNDKEVRGGKKRKSSVECIISSNTDA